MDRIGVNLSSLRQNIVAVMTNKLAADPRTFLQHVIDDSLSATDREPTQPPAVEVALRRLRAIIGVEADPATGPANPVESLASLVRPQAKAVGLRLAESLGSCILELVNTGSSRVEGARRAVTWADEFVRGLRKTAGEQAKAARQHCELSAKTLAGLQSQPRAPSQEIAAATLLDHAEHQLNALINEAICLALQAVAAAVTTASDQLRGIWTDLGQLATRFAAGSAADESESGANGNQTGAAAQGPPRMAELYAERKRYLIDELDQAIEKQFFREDRRLREILVGGGHMREELAAHMRASARKIVLRAYHRAVHQFLGQALHRTGDNDLAALVRGCLQTARPGLLDLGGAKRLLVAIPKQLDVVHLAGCIEQIAAEQASVSIEEEGDVKFCYEVEDLPWEGIHTRLIRQRHDCRELARRLHTRINVDWTVS
jgi:hypothetical protein